MQIIRKALAFWMWFPLVFSLQAQQQSSKSKSADKLYEKGELSRKVRIRNTSRINTDKLEFSPVFYENGIVYVSSRHKSGPIDKKIGESFFELYYAETDMDGMPGDPQNFSLQINSQVHEGPVSFDRFADVMYFTRSNSKRGITKANSSGKVGLKIYEAKRGTYDWQDVKELPFNSDEYSCVHPSFSSPDNTLYFASNMPGGYGGYDLYMVEKKADTWSKPINLGPEINSSANEVFPFIHESGTLFFSSDGHQGYGGLDMFKIDISDQTWGKVVNLGLPFNSPKDDLGFILNPEGTRGYFSSNRSGGLGEDDIYHFDADQSIIKTDINRSLNALLIAYDQKTDALVEGASVRIFERAADGFIEGNDLYDIQLLPGAETGELVMKLVRKNEEELGDPILFTNSSGEASQIVHANKNYMILVSKEGYESSELLYSTIGEEGLQTIRVPLKPKNCATLMGVVSVEKFKTRVPNALVRIVNECNDAEDVIRTNSKGEFEFCLPLGCDYSIHAEKEGYTNGLSKVSTVSSSSSQKVEVNVMLNPIADNILKEPIKEGSIIVLENIYYDFNKSAIRKGAARELGALVGLMKQYPSMEIELVAHTDSRGSEEYNLQLSLRRAESAKNYLVRNGIAANRIKAFGYGESQPRNNCTDAVDCTEEEYQYNRRTEVKVTKIDEPVKVQYQDGKPNEDGRM